MNVKGTNYDLNVICPWKWHNYYLYFFQIFFGKNNYWPVTLANLLCLVYCRICLLAIITSIFVCSYIVVGGRKFLLQAINILGPFQFKGVNYLFLFFFWYSKLPTVPCILLYTLISNGRELPWSYYYNLFCFFALTFWNVTRK